MPPPPKPGDIPEPAVDASARISSDSGTRARTVWPSLPVLGAKMVTVAGKPVTSICRVNVRNPVAPPSLSSIVSFGKYSPPATGVKDAMAAAGLVEAVVEKTTVRWLIRIELPKRSSEHRVVPDRCCCS